MRTMRWTVAIAAATLGLAALPAEAQTIAASSPDGIAAAMRDKGYQAELTKGSDGDPMIRSAAGGSKFVMLFFGCTSGRNCTTIQFYGGFKSDGSMSVGRVNEWNKTKRFGRAYIDNDGDPVIEMDVDLDAGGMSKALFVDNLEVWSALLGSYREYINKK